MTAYETFITDFHGLTITRDKQCSLIREWQILIEAFADVKTNDGYTVRLFALAFTDRCPEQVKVKCYAQIAQIKKIRRRCTRSCSRPSKSPPCTL